MGKNHYVIIGSGAAGSSAAFAIKNHDSSAGVTILTREPHPTYYKCDLTEYLCGNLTQEQLFCYSLDAFVDAGIRLRMMQKVIALDPENQYVYLAHRERIKYDKLLLATGVVSYVPPVFGQYYPFLNHLSTLTDADRFRSNKKCLQKSLIIGGGLTALKLALALKTMGTEVDYLMLKKQTCKLLLKEEDYSRIAGILDQEEINMLPTNSLTKVEQQGEKYVVTFTSGKKKTYTSIFIAAGVRPRIQLAVKTGITCDWGILVNEYFETSHRNIYAAGDVAQIYNPEIGDYWVNFGWPNACEQGLIAARNMIGNKEKYDLKKVNIFNIRGNTIQFKNWQ